MRSSSLAALLLFGLLAGAPARAGLVNRVAAVVNGDVITLSEVYALGGDFIESAVAGAPDPEEARRGAEIEVLDSLIQRRLVAQEIDRLDYDVDDTELDRVVDDIARRNGMDRESLQGEVERSGMAWSEYRNELREQQRQAKFNGYVIQPRIAVNEEDLREAWRKSYADTERPMIADLGAIFLSLPPDADEEVKAQVLALAEAARAREAAGEDFAALSQELDQGPYGSQGGRMGTYHQGDLVAQLDEPAFSLPAGATSGPVLTPQGVFLLHVFALRQEDPKPFEEAREELLQQVYSDRIEEELDLWVQQARRRAAVEVKLESVTGL